MNFKLGHFYKANFKVGSVSPWVLLLAGGASINFVQQITLCYCYVLTYLFLHMQWFLQVRVVRKFMSLTLEVTAWENRLLQGMPSLAACSNGCFWITVITVYDFLQQITTRYVLTYLRVQSLAGRGGRKNIELDQGTKMNEGDRRLSTIIVAPVTGPGRTERYQPRVKGK